MELRKLLTDVPRSYPTVHQSVDALYIAKVREQQATAMRFDHCSKSARREINKEQSHACGSWQDEKAFYIYWGIIKNIRALAQQAGPNASDEARRNALEELRKIGMTACLSAGGTIADKVQQNFQCATEMTDSMLAILDAMSEKQRVFIGKSWRPDGHKLFMDTLEELVSISEEKTVFPDLQLVLETLDGDDEATNIGRNEEKCADQEPGMEGCEKDQ